MSGLPATPELAAQLTQRLDLWDAELKRLEAEPSPSEGATAPASGNASVKNTSAQNTLAQSRRLLENYRRTLGRDLSRGLERVPAAELFRAIATAEASTAQLLVQRKVQDGPKTD